MEEACDAGKEGRGPRGRRSFQLPDARGPAENPREVGDRARRREDEHDRHDGEERDVEGPACVLLQEPFEQQAGHRSTVRP
ncbi:MAG: hypothetical protein KQH57_11375 [Actinomycetales bacterium]|nr:hypothetical protein [Actinomycetales bacterium]